mmetsp:Transcript_38697/g.60361  ORF Transcript_38697/g.60361 Transcript_38697/m.60361 type:complete len:232 (+) Transcript_38697:1258-1953(+)
MKHQLFNPPTKQVYNFRNLTTEFTVEGDRHKAIYGLLELVQGQKIRDSAKVSYGGMGGDPISKGYVVVRNRKASATGAMRDFYCRVFTFDRDSPAVWPALHNVDPLGALTVIYCYVGLEKYDDSLWLMLGAECSHHSFETMVFVGDYFRFWHTKGVEDTLLEAGIKEEYHSKIVGSIPQLKGPSKEDREFSGSINLESGEVTSSDRKIRWLQLNGLMRQAYASYGLEFFRS